MEQFKLAKVCGCADQYCARLQAVRDGLISFASEAEFLTYLAPQKVCPQPCEVASDSTLGWVNIPADSVELTLGDQCLETLINQAHYSAQVRYEQYLDSLQSVLNERYRQHCMGVVENFTYTYTDKQHHYTLYYYDQAGNLIRTVPPGGVEVLNITSENSTLNQQINADRLNGQKTVFTQHRLVTRYEYNSLNQLVAQFTPDTDPMNKFELQLTEGLPSNLVTNKIQMLNEQLGYLAGEVGNRGYLFRTTDGGNTWQRVHGLVGADFRKIRMINNSIGFAVGTRGTILKTTDGGTNWDIVSLNALVYSGELPDLNDMDYFSNATFPHDLTIIGDNGFALRSTDLNNFTMNVSGIVATHHLKSIANDGTVQVIVGTSSVGDVFYRRLTTSSSFTPLSAMQGLTLTTLDSLGTNLFIAAGIDGRLYTNDFSVATSNLKWTTLLSNLTETISDLKFFNANEGLAISNGKLYYTINGGQHWEKLNDNTYNSLAKSSDRSAIVAVGNGGRILLFSPGLLHQPTAVHSGVTSDFHRAWVEMEGTGTNVALNLVVSSNHVLRYTWNALQTSPSWQQFTPSVTQNITNLCLTKEPMQLTV